MAKMTPKERLEWMVAHFGVSARELAREAGVAESHPGQIFGNHSKGMTEKTVAKYAARWQVSLSWLASGEGEPLGTNQLDTGLDWRQYAKRYPAFAGEAELARANGYTEAELNAAAGRLGLHKGEGPTEDEARDAILHARSRSSAYKQPVGERDATDLLAPPGRKPKR